MQRASTAPDADRTFSYERRRPETTVLYRTLQQDLESFIGTVEGQSDDRTLPRFVKKELRAFLGCGILSRGFIRVRCSDCGHNRVVAFSCKGRGFCPSCGGRRMAETAAHLTDDVFPERPVRQWVLSLPHRLRYRLAYDKQAVAIALRAFINTVFSHLRRRAKQLHGVRNGEPGGITFIQRFASSLALNVHFHSLLLDGVYTQRSDGTLRFLPVPPPTDDEVAILTIKIRRRVLRALDRAGKLPGDLDPEPDDLAIDDPTRAAIYGAAVQNRIATGDRAGHGNERLGDRVDVEDVEHKSPRCAQVRGFSLHANVAVPARDRKRLERLCRYVARPPICTERLTWLEGGKIYYGFRKRWRDGTRGMAFTPHEFIERLVALIPPPQANLLRYHGVLAPASKLRTRVVADRRGTKASSGANTASRPTTETPRSVPPTTAEGSPDDGITGARVAAVPTTPPRAPPPTLPKAEPQHAPPAKRRMSWAELMKRVFALDVLQCPQCNGRMKVIAEITDPGVAKKILASLDLPTEPPPVERARPPPQLDLDLDAVDPIYDDDHLP